MKLLIPLFQLLSIALFCLAILMLTPLLLIFSGDSANASAFGAGAAATFIAAGCCRWLGHHGNGRLVPRQMYIITTGTWLTVPLFGMLPFVFMGGTLSTTDSVFESVSAMTTTGSTVITGLDKTSKDILLWRSVLQWFGGIGIIGMAIAILPSLKTGGMRLFQTESSDWSDKATPRTYRMLSGIILAYLGISVLCAFAYYLGGMSAFDAINHAMTTVSTGGFSTSDDSFGQFHSPILQWTCIVFMLAGSIPFLLYVRMCSHRNFSAIWDVQVMTLLGLVFVVSMILALDLGLTGQMGFKDALTVSFFNVTSVVSTTGYASADYAHWGNAAIALFFFLTFAGGCSGSTSGGIKIFRFQLCFALLKNQIVKSLHPNATIITKYGDRHVSEDIIQSCVAFLFFVATALVLLTFLLALTGLDFITSITGAATALMNVGPGLGNLIGPAGNFQTLPEAAKWLLCFGMLLGRLEFLAVMIIFTPTFWRG